MNITFAYDVLRSLHNCINALAAHENMDGFAFEEHLDWAREAFERAENILEQEAAQEAENAQTVQLDIAADKKIRKERE